MMSLKGDFLDRVALVKKEEIAALRKRSAPTIEPSRRDFVTGLRGERIRWIAEFKPASPSAGRFRPTMGPVEMARWYEAHGAGAISVLTDAVFFEGGWHLMREISLAVRSPILCKDFILDEIQIRTARGHGADAVLLLAALLDRPRLDGLLDAARRLGMEALVEVHSEAELDLALGTSARVIGINSRDLRTLRVHPERVPELARRVPPDRVVVGESGIRSRGDLVRLEGCVDAVLVGTAFMEAPEPGRVFEDLFGEPIRGRV
jgi:indole-3-glycerol phosphate synthase/phosphoribosylanthranilate isomerase/anthranilate synthase/indole-3-glycerol phosphate synthase/phosphoribosylanthranilate isomerase